MDVEQTGRSRYGIRVVLSSIAVNKNFPSAAHRDTNNVGPSLAKAFGGRKTGGGLRYWPQDKGSGHKAADLDASDSILLPIDGGNPYAYDGRLAHEAVEGTGDRWLVIFYLRSGCGKLPVDEAKELRELGFPLPSGNADEAEFAKRMSKDIGEKKKGFPIQPFT